jgi:NCAIR mutase (PurE)-related protein
MDNKTLTDLLQALQTGEREPNEVFRTLQRASGFADAQIDFSRADRTRIPEVVFGESKTAEQIARLLQAIQDAGETAFATRVSVEKAAFVCAACPSAEYFEAARIVRLGVAPAKKVPGPVGILCAGTSDLPVAEEAAITLETLGYPVTRVCDVGVAGIHRLFGALPDIASCRVLIVIAGMEGALPSVVAGLSDRPVIAVPTSVGYGAAFEGLTALLSMMNSCAPGVSVVNIDNGFGAACQAVLILHAHEA